MPDVGVLVRDDFHAYEFGPCASASETAFALKYRTRRFLDASLNNSVFGGL